MNWIRWGRKWKAMSLLPSPLPPKGLFAILQTDSLCFLLTADTKVHSYCKFHTTEIILLSTSLNINNSGTESQ
jgi:hypothetical protein